MNIFVDFFKRFSSTFCQRPFPKYVGICRRFYWRCCPSFVDLFVDVFVDLLLTSLLPIYRLFYVFVKVVEHLLFPFFSTFFRSFCKRPFPKYVGCLLLQKEDSPHAHPGFSLSIKGLGNSEFRNAFFSFFSFNFLLFCLLTFFRFLLVYLLLRRKRIFQSFILSS